MLARERRINAARDFHNIYKTGRRIAGRYVLIFFRPSQKDYSRVGFVVSKKVGNAVIRNQVKRRLRAIIYEILPAIETPYDLVINARPGIKGISSELIEKDLLRTIKKGKLC